MKNASPPPSDAASATMSPRIVDPAANARVASDTGREVTPSVVTAGMAIGWDVRLSLAGQLAQWSRHRPTSGADGRRVPQVAHVAPLAVPVDADDLGVDYRL